MSRNSSGVYSLPPSVNPVVAGTIITDEWANTTMEDVAAELTNSLDRYGRGGMLAPFLNADGTVAAPGITFANESTTGFSRPSPNVIAMSIAGVEIMRWTDEGIVMATGLQLVQDVVPSGPDSVVNKDYVDTNFLPLTGGTITGDLGIGVAPHPSNIASKTILEFCHQGTGFSASSSDAGRTIAITSNAYEDATNWRYAAAGRAIVMNFSKDGWATYRANATPGAAGDPISWNPVMTSDGNGSIIMHPTASACTLSINGIHANNGSSGVDQFALKVYGSYGGGFAMQDSGACFGQWCASGYMYQGVTHAGGGGALTHVLRWTLNASTPELTVVNLPSTGAGIWFDGAATARRAFWGMEAGTDSHFRLYGAPGGLNCFTVQLNGAGTQFSGQVAAGSFNVVSSIEVKENFRPFTPGALERVLGWNLLEYDLIKGAKNMMGVIAEYTDSRISDGKSVSLQNALWELAGAVHELSRRVH